VKAAAAARPKKGRKDMRLTEMKPDQNGLIQKIGGDAHFLNRITAIGVTEGTEFQTVRNDKKMPMLIYLRETLIAINRVDAERIKVESV
jgi:ferrous iron transport protein A